MQFVKYSWIILSGLQVLGYPVADPQIVEELVQESPSYSYSVLDFGANNDSFLKTISIIWNPDDSFLNAFFNSTPPTPPTTTSTTTTTTTPRTTISQRIGNRWVPIPISPSLSGVSPASFLNALFSTIGPFVTAPQTSTVPPPIFLQEQIDLGLGQRSFASPPVLKQRKRRRRKKKLTTKAPIIEFSTIPPTSPPIPRPFPGLFRYADDISSFDFEEEVISTTKETFIPTKQSTTQPNNVNLTRSLFPLTPSLLSNSSNNLLIVGFQLNNETMQRLLNILPLT